jgi:Spx/MgsR family transcriptional regulator
MGDSASTGVRMDKTELYYYASCSSCRSAESLLNELGIEFEKHEYFKQRFTPDELKALLQRIGKSPSDVLSTRSRPYKDLELAGKFLSDDDLIALMIEHPQLIKRPLTVRGTESVVGYNKGAIAALVEGIE